MDFLQISRSKIIRPEALQSLLACWRFTDQKIVFTNGCFDIIHLGHIDYVAKARNLGNKLIIGLNTDNSVRRLKGKDRPVNNENARAMVLSSFTFVDAIVLFDEDTPYNLIKTVRPDILVKGSDYKPEEIVGGDFVAANGGSIQTIDFLEGYSTTTIINKLTGC
jgi:rfaE bifunctional protein nucleotidyltransferase chain/domain